MKKYLFLAAIAVLVMSCSSDEIISESDKRNGAIEFSTLTDKSQSRVAVTEKDNILSFTLTGWWVTGAQYLFNAFDITRSPGMDENGARLDDEWSYSPPRYWPSKGNVNFFAYSPASSINVNKDKDLRQTGPLSTDPEIEYTVPTKQNFQEDFLVALKLLQNKNTGKVGLNFQHALSRVKFNAKKTKNIEYTIHGITLKNLCSTGTLTFNKANDGTITDGIPYGLFSYGNSSNLPVVLWKNHSNKVDYEFDMSDAPIYVQFDNKSVIGESNALVVLPQVTTLGNVPVDSSDPEFINKPDPATPNAFYIEVSYKAFLREGNKTVYFAGNAATPAKFYLRVLDQIRVNNETAFPFEMAREYAFNLIFGDEGATGKAIEFEVDVAEWPDTPEQVQI